MLTAAAAPFYITGGTVPRDAPSYIVRQADHALLEGLRNGQFCYILTTRQMGKSSLMGRTAQRLRQEGVSCVTLDLTAIGQNLTQEQWYDGLLNLIGRQLDLEDALEDHWLTHARLGPLQRWMLALEEVVLAKSAGQVVVFVDEIDTVRNLPFSADEFFAAIRECYNRRTQDPDFQRLSFCLLGVATPSDLIRDTRNTPFNIGTRIELNDFTPEEAAPLAQGLGVGKSPISHVEDSEPPIPNSPDPTPEAQRLLERVLYWTGGHPYLTQRLCQAVAEALLKEEPQMQGEEISAPNAQRLTPNAQLVDRLCDDLFLSASAQDRDDNLLFVRERLLRSEVDLTSLLDLYGQVQTCRRVNKDETNPLVSVLWLSGIVRAVRGCLCVRNRIYERVFDRCWVQANMPGAELRRQRMAYRRGMLRTAAIAGMILTAMTGLAVKAVRETGVARMKTREAQLSAAALLGALKRADAAQRQAGIDREKAEERRQFADRQSKEAQRQANRANVKAQEVLRANVETRMALREAVRARKDATGRLVGSYLAQAEAWRWSHKLGQRFAGLDAIRSAAALKPSPEMRLKLRNAAIASMALPTDLRLRKRFLRKVDGSGIFAYDRERNRYFHTDAQGNIRIRRIREDLEIARLPGPGLPVIQMSRCSPDGRFLAVVYGKVNDIYESSSRTIIWDVARRKALLSTGAGPLVIYLDFSPDGRWMARPAGNAVILTDLATGRDRQRIPLPMEAGVVRFHPGGRKLAVGAGSEQDGRVGLFDLDGGKAVVVTAPDGTGDLAWSPDGTRLAGACRDYHIYVWDAATGAQVANIAGHKNYVTALAFNHHGSLLASNSWDNTTRLWEPGAGKPLLVCPYETCLLEFSRDDLFLYMKGSKEMSAWEVADSRPCREILPNALPRAVHMDGVDFSPDGRLLASSDEQSVKLWDVASRREIGAVPAGNSASVAFLPDGKSLLTYGTNGLLRWPFTGGPHDGERQIGLPASLDDLISGRYRFCLSPDGRLLAAIHSDAGGVPDHAHILDLSGAAPPVLLKGYYGLAHIAVSPDRRWIAAGRHQRLGVRVWEARSGKAVVDLPIYSRATVCFTPDGKFLVTCSESEYRFWKAGTWQPGPGIARESGLAGPRVAAFTRDGRIMAVIFSNALVQLLDTRTRKPFATLESPSAEDVMRLCFSPDGSRLAVSCEDRILLWDLREIRRRLAEDSLDWDLPPYPASGGAPPRPLRVHLRQEGLAPFLKLLKARRNIASCINRIQQRPNDSTALNALARVYVTGPVSIRDPKKALPLAEKAIALAPTGFGYVNTLGIVCYRLGLFDRAIPMLQNSLKAGLGQTDAYDLFFLAMCYQRQEKREQARENYDRAVRWWQGKTDLDPQYVEELTDIRAEAESLLGIGKKEH